MVGLLDVLLLRGALCDKPKCAHRLCMTDVVGAVHDLQVDLCVTMAVVDHNHIGRDKVDAEAAGTGSQEKAELLAARSVELLRLGAATLAHESDKELGIFFEGQGLGHVLFHHLVVVA